MAKEAKNIRQKNNDFYVVGVGTSAGGLDALDKLLGSFNGEAYKLSVIVVQHLSPSYKSELATILGRQCKWPVMTAQDGMEILPYHIYVTPQNKTIKLGKDHAIILGELPPNYSHAPSIDDFFVSLAEAEKQNAIGIILSGSGQDGAKGFEAIKDCGGFTIAQTPVSAQYGDMPEAAIQTDAVDLVSHPAKMFEEITYYIKNHRVVRETSDNQKSVDVVFELLSKRTGIDFSQYKPNTIIRRLEKRIEALRLHNIGEYYQWIRKNPTELDLLFETVLIGVTEFFRDKEAFGKLKDELENQLKQKKYGETIRIWCVGCATGEEPYSIAILISELLEKSEENHHLQIFATDIDERALSFARKGLYDRKRLEGLSGEYIEKYFDQNENGFEVKKQLKQYILFSRHDITNDPPFVKLDIIVCRNLLIYFNNHLQKEVLRIFSYALKQDALLFLGKSESVSVLQDNFEKLEGIKLYKKISSQTGLNLRFSRYNRTKSDNANSPANVSRNISLIENAKDTFYYANQSPFVIINEQGDIKEAQGSLRLYMDIGKGGANNNVLKTANREFLMEIRALLMQVKKTGSTLSSPVIKFNLFDADHFVRLKMTPLIYSTPNAHFYLLIFEDIKPEQSFIEFSSELSKQDFEDYRIKELEHETTSLREHLQTFTEELETTNEEMQAINEELQSANEELKSANEELETSNEELQSSNEELNTSNQELRISNGLLIDKENELQKEKQLSEQNALLYKTIAENIPNGTVGILNNKFEVEYVAGKGLLKYNIKPEDVLGKALPQLNADEDERKKLINAFEATLQGTPCTLEFSYLGFTYLLNTVPLHFDGSETKIMYLTQDITDRKKSEVLMHQSEERFRTLADNIPALCWIANSDGWIFWYNSRWFEYTGTTLEDMQGWGWQSVHDATVLPQVIEKWTTSLKSKLPFEMTFPLKGKDSKFRPFLTRVIPLLNDNQEAVQWFGINTDISEQESQAQQLEKLVQERTADLRLLNQTLENKNTELVQAHQFLQLVIDSSVEYIAVYDHTLKCIMANEQFCEVLQMDAKDIVGKSVEDIQPEINGMQEMSACKEALNGNKIHLEKRNAYFAPQLLIDLYIIPYKSGDNIQGIITMGRNVMDIYRAEELLERKNTELNQSNENLQQFAFVASHDLKEPIRKIKTFSSMVVREFGPDMPERGLLFLEKIQSAAGRMIEMVDGLLSYSSIDSVQDLKESVDLNLVIQNIVSDLEFIIDDKKAVIHVGPLPTVEGASNLLYQLFLNLVKNALKFSRPEIPPEVNIAARLYDRDKQPFVDITVTDNGIGFTSSEADKIFGTFVRLHSKDRYEGTGLGLALCKRIVDYHHGSIVASGEPMQGAVFTVSLPIKTTV